MFNSPVTNDSCPLSTNTRLHLSTLCHIMPLPNHWTHEDIWGLSLVPRMKMVRLKQWVEEYSSLEHLLDDAPEELLQMGIARGSLFQSRVAGNIRELAAKQHERCQAQNIRTITFWDDEYPAHLQHIFYPPVLLYVRGVLQKRDAAAISIVGTRHCTDYGKLTAERYADAFARSRVVVVSGLAMGVDTIVHKAVVAARGVTYAVVASGLDKLNSYNEQLAQAIDAAGGAVLSEYPCGTAALPAYFPQRNRIISGISQATVVIESGEKGGSLITAKFALDQNRELFAVPGRISSDKSRGTNLLIQRSQAYLTLAPDDVLSTLGWADKGASSASAAPLLDEPLSAVEQRVYDVLSLEPIQIDALALASQVPVHELLVVLLELEFKGYVRQLPGKQFLRAR